MIIADGFSCREQVRQTTPRRALHMAEVLKLGISTTEGSVAGRSGDRPEEWVRSSAPRELVEAAGPSRGAIALGVGIAVGSSLAWRYARDRP
jgi:hypothetical protein